jgi:hypothetical protein
MYLPSQSTGIKPSQAQRATVGGGTGGLGGLGLARCRFVFKCYPCERCFPFTDVCFSSTCCDLSGFECTIG